MDIQCIIKAFSNSEELTKFALSDRCGLYGESFQMLIDQAIAEGVLSIASTDFDETGEEVPLTFTLSEKGKLLR